MDFFIGFMTYRNERLNWDYDGDVNTHQLCSNRYNFIILQEEINIQDIEEFETAGCHIRFNDTFISTESLVNDLQIKKINELVQAVKYLENKLKEK